MSRIRACFVAPFAYPLFDPTSSNRIGGAEVRAVRLARGLAERGKMNVSVVVQNHGQPRYQRFGDLEVIAYCPEGGKGPLRPGWRAWTSLGSDSFIENSAPAFRSYFLSREKVTTYFEINADVYVGFGINDWTAELAAFTRRASKRLILCVSSDEDLSECYIPGSTQLNSYFSTADRCYFALKNADQLIVQTERQRDLAYQRFGIQSHIMKSPADVPSELDRAAGNGMRVVWIGRADQVKQPILFARLAQEFPEVSFDMVMTPNLEEISNVVRDKRPENLNILNFLPNQEVSNWLRGAAVLVNTSRFEGFPNSFLEAWASGIPVLSYNVDPGGVIERHGCGVMAGGDWGRFVAGLQHLLNDVEFRSDCGRRSRSYVMENHSLAVAVDKLDAIIREIAWPTIMGHWRQRILGRQPYFPLHGQWRQLYQASFPAHTASKWRGLKRKTRVCFVAPYAYSVFNPQTQFQFGGIEVQAHLLATALAEREQFVVSFIVWDHGQPPFETVSNVNLFSSLDEETWVTTTRRSLARIYHRLRRIPVGFVKNRLKRAQLGHRLATTAVGEAASAISSGEALPIKSDTKDDVIALLERLFGTENTKSSNRFIGVVRYTSWHLIKFWFRVVDFFLETVLSQIWLFKRWRELDKPPLHLAKRMVTVNRILKYQSIDADVYVSFGASNFSAELVGFCKVARKPAIIFIASDSDLSKDHFRGSKRRGPYGDLGDNCYFVIHSADALVVQTERQKRLAWDIFQRPSTVIPNPIDLTIRSNHNRGLESRKYVAWMGKADKVKQPEIFIELAKHFPDLRFRMVMNPIDLEVERLVTANMPDNVERIERISRNDISDYFEEAIVLVNTSHFEGFPNSFIEACRAGTPLLSLSVDSNEILSRHNCGRFAAGSFEKLVEELRRICGDREIWDTHHEAALKYVKVHHDRAVCGDQLVKEINSILEPQSQNPARC